MGFIESCKSFLAATADGLSGAARRLFMARTVAEHGPGGQMVAERELGWNRQTIRKGTHELTSGIACADAYHMRGRRRAEEHLPNLLADIKDIVDSQSQTDPRFRNDRLYTRLSAAEVRRQLIARKGYTDELLPTEETIRVRLNELGFHVRSVLKNQPKKKTPQTNLVFEQLEQEHRDADADPTTLRVSMDAKATAKIGPFSRGGAGRVPTNAFDHDFHPETKLTPWGIFLPKYDDLWMYFTESRITADYIVDRLEDWWTENKPRFPQVTTLLINQDNGPENSSRRTQFVKRMIEFANKHRINIRLAYYPPYHSKYNPVERCWGILENHWNGSILDTVQAALKFAATMTWNGKNPVVRLVAGVYETGIKLGAKAMAALERQIQRMPELSKYFVTIPGGPIIAADG